MRASAYCSTEGVSEKHASMRNLRAPGRQLGQAFHQAARWARTCIAQVNGLKRENHQMAARRELSKHLEQYGNQNGQRTRRASARRRTEAGSWGHRAESLLMARVRQCRGCCIAWARTLSCLRTVTRDDRAADTVAQQVLAHESYRGAAGLQWCTRARQPRCGWRMSRL